MSALIFGVTGQIGSYLAEYLLSKNIDVIGFNRRTSSNNTWRIKSILNKITLLEGDITDYSSIYRTINKYRPYYIVNLAAMSHVHKSFDQPLYTWDITAKGQLNVLEVVRSIGKYNPKICFSASSEMFGNQYDFSWDGQKVQYEKTRMIPNSPYGIAKLAGFNVTELYRRSYNMFASNVIMFNTESPRRGDNFVTKKIAQYIGKLYNKINLGEEMSKLKLGNLSASRDWGSAEDKCEGIYLILQQDYPDDFVLATGETHTVEEFVMEAFDYVGLNWKDWVEIDKSLFRPSEVPYLCGCAQKAKEVLGWEPKTTFKELVHRMIDYEIKNRR